MELMESMAVAAPVVVAAFVATMGICYAGESVVRFVFWLSDHWSHEGE